MKSRAAAVTLAAVVSTSTALVAVPPPAWAVQPRQTAVVSAVPQAKTPEIANGAVFAIAQVGSSMVVGGSFTRAAASGSGDVRSTPYILAFDATTGVMRTSFAPRLDGAVQTLLPGPVAGTVYVGGRFRTMDGAKARQVLLLDVTDGSRVTSFDMPQTDLANVQTVKRVGNRLYVGGAFRKVGGLPRAGLVTLNATTGAVDPFMASAVTVNHNWTSSSPKGTAKAPVGVSKLDISPDGSKMVAIGNFQQVDGATHDQIAMWDLTGHTAELRNWNTSRLKASCTAKAFDSYVRDVDFSPDGSYFVLANTGGYGTGSLCDSASRWESNATGQDVQPSWVDFTGKDTLLSVAVTGEAVYVGGHQRWLNNGRGADSAGPGAVPRPGVAALDPVNGLPLAWNPGRSPRGAGAYTLYATPSGLWMGSDTNFVGNYRYKRPKIAFFPLTGGQSTAAKSVPTLPGQVYLGTAAGSLSTRSFNGTSAGSATTVSSPLDVAAVRGAMVIGDALFYGKADGNLYRRTLRDGGWGAETAVDPYDDPAWSNVKTGSGGVYQGMKPSFYGQIPGLTSMFYDGSGTMYYTLANQSGLYSRAFSPDSGVVHDDEVRVPGVTLPDVTGAFLAGNTLYYATRSNGNLNRVGFDGTRLTGPTTVVSGPGKDGIDWRSRVLYLGPQATGNQTSVANPVVTCTQLRCTADGSGSSDPDGTVSTYRWTWGDGGTSTGANPTHDYATAGTYQVTLTVTDNKGATGTAGRSVTVNRDVNPSSSIAFRDSSTLSSNWSKLLEIPVPADVRAGDALLLKVSTSSKTSNPTPPDGWDEVARQVAGSALTVVWQRVATPQDALGATVEVQLTDPIKSTSQILAYSGTADTSPVSVATTGNDTRLVTSHVAPAVQVPADGSWVVSFWTDKSSRTTSWTPPAGLSVRVHSYGTGTGYLTTIMGDEGSPHSAGQVPQRTATTDTPSRAAMISLVLSPANR